MNAQITAVAVVALSLFWVLGCYIDMGIQQAKESVK